MFLFFLRLVRWVDPALPRIRMKRGLAVPLQLPGGLGELALA